MKSLLVLPVALSATGQQQPVPNTVIELVKARATALAPQIIAMRRHMHQFPEASYCEVKTRAYIREQLDLLGIPYELSGMSNSIIATIEGGAGDGPIIGLRADFDALADFTESAPVDFCSKHPNLMHACGHDCHASMLLGAAAMLQDFKKALKGTVKLVFEASEEKVPGGSKIMIREGIFQKQGIQKMIGLHVDPRLKVGHWGFRSGDFMFGNDEIYIKVRGAAGHGATVKPNATHVASEIMYVLTKYVNKEIKAKYQLSDDVCPVLSFGSHYTAGQEADAAEPFVNQYRVLDSMEMLPIRKAACETPFQRIVGGSTNVVMATVKIEGTLRTFDPVLRAEIHKKLLSEAARIVDENQFEGKLSCDFRIYEGHPVVHNHPALTDTCIDLAKQYNGSAKVQSLAPWKASESFSQYGQFSPAVFMRLGIQPMDSDVVTPLHTDRLYVDEGCLEVGAGFMTYIALTELSK